MSRHNPLSSPLPLATKMMSASQSAAYEAASKKRPLFADADAAKKLTKKRMAAAAADVPKKKRVRAADADAKKKRVTDLSRVQGRLDAINEVLGRVVPCTSDPECGFVCMLNMIADPATSRVLLPSCMQELSALRAIISPDVADLAIKYYSRRGQRERQIVSKARDMCSMVSKQKESAVLKSLSDVEAGVCAILRDKYPGVMHGIVSSPSSSSHAIEQDIAALRAAVVEGSFLYSAFFPLTSNAAARVPSVFNPDQRVTFPVAPASPAPPAPPAAPASPAPPASLSSDDEDDDDAVDRHEGIDVTGSSSDDGSGSDSE